MSTDPRLSAARQVQAVLQDGQSLAQIRSESAQPGLTQALSYGVLRHLLVLQQLLGARLKRPLKTRDEDLRCLLLCGLFELGWMATPAHAVVSQTVVASRRLRKAWASGLVNAVLRGYQRDGCPQFIDSLSAQEASNHPDWLYRAISQAWPKQADAVLAANNRQAPMTLRVNLARVERRRYLQQLEAAGIEASACGWTEGCVQLAQAVPVRELPGFDAGLVSVQDAAAQLAGPLLDPPDGGRVLDACAAPGGKTGQLLELGRNIELTAVDADPQRCQLIEDNLQRLQLECRVLSADAAALPAPDGPGYDAILLDAPCSASGVIRRHPDIKWLRRDTDIQALSELQGRLLDHLWSLLRPGGRLLYATCSLLPAENGRTIAAFLERCPEAAMQELPLAFGVDADPGRQILPGDHDADGFYYALLQKTDR